MAPSVTATGRWLEDRDTRLPAELARGFLLEVRPTRKQELLGATPETVEAYENLLAFERARGVTVRERDLPATEDETIKGAYSPDLSTMVLGSASTAEDSDGLQTLVHESAHSILHDTRCMPVPTPDAEYLAGYDDSPEEIEANATALLVLQRLGVPLEIDDGTVISPKDWHVTEDALREQLDP